MSEQRTALGQEGRERNIQVIALKVAMAHKVEVDPLEQRVALDEVLGEEPHTLLSLVADDRKDDGGAKGRRSVANEVVAQAGACKQQLAPAATYRLTEAELGHRVIVQIAATIQRADRAATVATREVEVFTPVVEGPPANEAPPTIEGTTTAGETLTASSGEWSGGGGPLDFAYQWRRCNAEGSSCADIRGATDTTYALGLDDVGRTVRVVVRASHENVEASATSNPTEVIAAADAASNTEPPTISGEATELQTLRAEHGAWRGDAPISYAYQWERCKGDGSDCADIDGATEAAYRIPRSSADLALRVRVIATNGAGPAAATSAATEPVVAAPAPVNTRLPRLTQLGPAEVGATFMTEGGAWEHADRTDLSYVWQRCDLDGENCADIPGVASNAYDVTSDDVGARIQVEVLALSDDGDATATSELSPPIVASTGSAAGMLVYSDGLSLGIAQTDGRDAEFVAFCPGVCDFQHPRISPNGKMIVAGTVPSFGEEPARIVVMNRDGSAQRTIETPTEAYEPSWAPDGTAILYTAEEGEGHWGLARVSADGSNAEAPETIPTQGTEQWAAEYSADGEHLIYTAAGGEEERVLYVADADGSAAHEVQLDGPVADVENPVLSPDGTEVTFSAPTTTPNMPAEVHDVYSAHVDGSHVQRLTQDGDSYDSATALGDGTVLTIHRSVIVTEFGGGQSIELRDPTAWRMDRNGANGAPLPLAHATEVSVGHRGGPTAHAAVSLPFGLNPSEVRYCLVRVRLCWTWDGDKKKAERLSQLYFTGEIHTDDTIANAFRHSLWVAFMAHTATSQGRSVLAGMRMGELHEIGPNGPFWKSREPRERHRSLMDMHNDYVGQDLMLDTEVQRHNEHYICSHILSRLRRGKRITEAQVDDNNVDRKVPYWYRKTDASGNPVVLIESHLPDRECG